MYLSENYSKSYVNMSFSPWGEGTLIRDYINHANFKSHISVSKLGRHAELHKFNKGHPRLTPTVYITYRSRNELLKSQ